MKNLPLVCPCILKKTITRHGNSLFCSERNCEHSKKENAFPIFNTIPIMISETRTDTLCKVEVTKSYVDRPFRNYIKTKKFVYGESYVTKSNCNKFIKEISNLNKKIKVLIIGGAEKGLGTEELWNAENIETHSVDIYATKNVDVICDAHYLPLKDNSYDGVWIQAVLEHVVEPHKVVKEIFRVLKIGGIVYAETPFMQQVHEGAYDFTRYTVLGHRYLFKNFECIEIGGIKGPELVFAWSTKYLIWSITRSRKIARLMGLFIEILTRPIALFTSKKSLYDASSAVYFLGKKVCGYHLRHKDLPKLYKGLI